MDILLRENLDDGWMEVRQDGRIRRLCSDDGLVQSEIDLDHPERLPNPVNRAMLAHLLFRPAPRRALLAGCGGGAVARWLRARSPETQGVAVELSPQIAALARSHFDFPADGDWSLRIGDVREHLRDAGQTYDFILVDIAESGYTPDWVSAPGFLSDCRRCLSMDGVLSLNLIPRDEADFTRALWRLRRIFETRVLCLSLPERGNVICLAFASLPDAQAARRDREAAAGRWGLELDRFYDRLRRDNPPGSGIF